MKIRICWQRVASEAKATSMTILIEVIKSVHTTDSQHIMQIANTRFQPRYNYAAVFSDAACLL